MQAQWRLRPPVHWLVAGFLKYKPPPYAAPAVEPAEAQETGRVSVEALKRDLAADR